MEIAIIGCGEVGYLYASLLASQGYSLSLCAPRPSDRVIKLAFGNQNITLHKNLGAWLKKAEVVISCTSGVVALDVASAAIPFLKNGTVYADFSTAAPRDKQQGALLAESKGIFFDDVVIMGGINLMGVKTPLLCAGDNTEKIVTVMEQLGAPIRVLSGAKAGDAASLKLFRTVFTKGLSALAVECIVAAEQHGVKELLYEVLSDIDETPLSEFLDMLLRNHVVHACRQRQEIVEATHQFKNMGLDVIMLPAIEALFATTCDALSIEPCKAVNPTTEEALTWLLKTRGTELN